MARRRRRRQRARIRFKRKFPFVQLGSSAKAHRERLERTSAAIVRDANDAVREVDRGRCGEALKWLVSSSMAYGGTSCNAISADTNFPQSAKNAHHTAWRKFLDRCVVK